MMRYQIIHDTPGRLRVRFGPDFFNREEGFGIAGLLKQEAGAISVETTPVNGGVLIYYPAGNREHIVSLLDSVSTRSCLPKGKPDDEAKLKEASCEFQNQLISHVGKHYLRKLLLPAPIRTAITLYRAARYIKNGLSALSDGQLNVAVLDAASIGTSLLQKSYSTAASIMMLLGVSELLEDYTRKKTRLALSQSLALNIDRVWLVQGKSEEAVPISTIRPGDTICVRSGSVIPLDGEISGGEAMVNESSMTGEPLAVLRAEGDSVFAGTVVEEGTLYIRVRTLANDTRLTKIASMIDTSETLKADVQSHAEQLADRIVPFSLLTALLTLAATRDPVKAASVLMVDYSCALKLSTPICVISAMHEAADHNMMVKGGKFLETFSRADTIVFDKTGTLTDACPKVAKVIPMAGYERNEVLRTAACLEEHFPHSVAKAIVRQAELEQLSHREEHAEVKYVVAHGIASTLYGERVLIGSSHFVFDDEGILISEEEQQIIDAETNGYSTIFLSIGDRLAGIICVEDPVRPEAKEVIQKLKALGIRHIIMLTGDSEPAAIAACKALGITEYRSQVLPEDKASIIQKLKASGHTVIMTGDGINDSPALSAADVSVAMKDGSDIAREVADIALLSRDLHRLVILRQLSTALMDRIHKNYRFILGFNTSLIAGGILGILGPSSAAFLHNLSTMAVSVYSTKRFLKDMSKKEP